MEAKYYWQEAGYVLGDRYRWVNNLDPSQTEISDTFEPTEGVADGILSLTIPSAFSSPKIAEKVNICTPGFSTARNKPREFVFNRAGPDTRFGLSPFQRTDVGERPVFSEDEKIRYSVSMGSAGRGTTGPSPQEEQTEQARINRLAANQMVSSADSPDSDSYPVSSLDPHGAVDASNTCDLRIPLLAVEHSEDSSPGDAATDRGRLDLAAIMTFLRLFNIVHLPVFGLVTRGESGAMTCGWIDNVSAVKDVQKRIILLRRQEPVPPAERFPVEVSRAADSGR